MTTEFVSLYDEEPGKTLGVLLMSLGRKNERFNVKLTRIPQAKKSDISVRTYQSRYIQYAKRVAAETETEETAVQCPQENDRMKQCPNRNRKNRKRGKKRWKTKKST